MYVSGKQVASPKMRRGGGEADEREGMGKRREGIKGGKGREGRRGDGSIPALLFPT